VLADARDCAETCERYLEGAEPARLERNVHVLAAPVAVSRVLISLLDHPPQLVLSAVGLCHDLCSAAAEQLEGGPAHVVAALRRVAGSAAELLDAVA
jgi:hypothetical protein